VVVYQAKVRRRRRQERQRNPERVLRDAGNTIRLS
jgi:hypothetical protein